MTNGIFCRAHSHQLHGGVNVGMRQKLFFLVAAKEDVKAREKEKNPKGRDKSEQKSLKRSQEKKKNDSRAKKDMEKRKKRTRGGVFLPYQRVRRRCLCFYTIIRGRYVTRKALWGLSRRERETEKKTEKKEKIYIGKTKKGREKPRKNPLEKALHPS